MGDDRVGIRRDEAAFGVRFSAQCFVLEEVGEVDIDVSYENCGRWDVIRAGFPICRFRWFDGAIIRACVNVLRFRQRFYEDLVVVVPNVVYR